MNVRHELPPFQIGAVPGVEDERIRMLFLPAMVADVVLSRRRANTPSNRPMGHGVDGTAMNAGERAATGASIDS